MDNKGYVETQQPQSQQPQYGMQPYPYTSYTSSGYNASAPPTTVVVQHRESMPSMVGQIVLSCVVFWLCNCLFGAIAFFIAIAGLSAHSPDEGRHLGKASMWVSIAGIIITVVLIIIVLGLYFGGVFHYNAYYSSYNYNG